MSWSIKGTKCFNAVLRKKTRKQKKPPAIFLAPWPHSTKINAAVTSAYLHPQEVFFVLHNRSRLNSLMCQHLLQFLLQSKQKADVVRWKKKKKKSALIYSRSSKRLERFRQCLLKWPQISKQKAAARNSAAHKRFYFFKSWRTLVLILQQQSFLYFLHRLKKKKNPALPTPETSS